MNLPLNVPAEHADLVEHARQGALGPRQNPFETFAEECRAMNDDFRSGDIGVATLLDRTKDIADRLEAAV